MTTKNKDPNLRPTIRLSAEEMQKLAWISEEYSLTKSQIIRKLIQEIKLNSILSTEEKITLYENSKQISKVGTNINQAIKRGLLIENKEIQELKALLNDNLTLVKQITKRK